MSFGHVVVSGNRRDPIHYVMGVRPAPKKWHKKHVGWFGHFVLLFIMVLFGMFTVQARDMILQAAGSQLSSLSPADLHPSGQAPQKSLLHDAPATAPNIVEMQAMLASWAKDHKPMQWGMAVKSLGGPQIDSSVQPDAMFQSRAMYKVFLAAAIYNQTPYEKQYKSLRVGNSRISVSNCIEKMFKADDLACTDALGAYLDVPGANDFLKKAGATHSKLSVSSRTVQTNANDSANIFTGINGSLLSQKSTKQLQKYLSEQPQNRQLNISCPGCSTLGVSDYGVGRLEAAGIVNYSKGSYLLMIYATGGTQDLVTQLSGKIQQKIVETTTPNLHYLP